MNARTELATRPAHREVARQEQEAASTQISRLAPPVDVFEDDRGITLYADMPGVPRDKLEVQVQDGSLTIEGEAVVPTPAGLRLQHGEVRNPRFTRAFLLSPELDVTRIDAQIRDGVLRLVIPRREEAKPRRIQVNAG